MRQWFQPAQCLGRDGGRPLAPYVSRASSIVGQRSMIIVSPASTTRCAASSSMTPSWNQTTRAPAAMASSANAASPIGADEHVDDVRRPDGRCGRGDRRVPLLAVHHLGPGVDGDDALAVSAAGPRTPRRRERPGLSPSPTTNQVVVSASAARISSGRFMRWGGRGRGRSSRRRARPVGSRALRASMTVRGPCPSGMVAGSRSRYSDHSVPSTTSSAPARAAGRSGW